jgi:mannose-6-phosphate isomerase class I
MNRNRFDKNPIVRIKGFDDAVFSGWEHIGNEIKQQTSGSQKSVVVLETYQGVFYEKLLDEVKKVLQPDEIIESKYSMYSEDKIREITFPDVTDDRIFGFMTRLKMKDLFDEYLVSKAAQRIEDMDKNTILVIGPGASLIAPNPDIFIYADMARWEIQLRMRNNQVNNLGLENREESTEEQYKRGFFLDWRICDRLKRETMEKWDYLLDTNRHEQPKLVTGEAIREGLKQNVQQPFSVVPYFDAGPWGGQWLKEVCDLDRETPNFAWSINCIPEENSLLLGFKDAVVEIPSINAVFFQPTQLLGEAVYGRFGAEFPIRFDFLDTMDGGNLSLQVHPTTDYIQQAFGMHYTQDESYYLMDAGDDASVYLGLKTNADKQKMIKDLENSRETGEAFDDTKYIEKWPAKKHDHFSIPAGTIHCSGKNSMVLEISSTPYIFTFKLWDWGRLGLDGKPRPINIEHGKKVIQWHRDKDWVKSNLINQVKKIDEGEGWREEKTGLYQSEFIETRRHWFTKPVMHDTEGNLNVLNLVEGKEVVVESPNHAFEPFIVHYAETFIVPASVGKYTIRPYGLSEGEQCATIKAHVRVS